MPRNHHPSASTSRSQHSQIALFLTIAYGVLVAYGTLYPAGEWRTPGASPWTLIFLHGVDFKLNPDTLTNILVYIPLGLLFVRTVKLQRRMFLAILLTLLVSGLMSFTLEYIQAYIPGRVPSLRDLVLNVSGAIAGALIACVSRGNSRIGHGLLQLRKNYVVQGRLANFGLLVVGLWMLSQLSPFVPSFDIGLLRHGLKPMWHSLQDFSSFNQSQMLVYACSVLGLGLLAGTFIQSGHRPLLLFAGFLAAVLALKVPVVSRQLSLEALSGTVTGLLIVFAVAKLPKRQSLAVAAVAIVCAVILDGMRSSAGYTSSTNIFNWVPFRGHMTNNLIGIADILGGLWPFLGLSYLALYLHPRHPRLVATSGALAVCAIAFTLEWNQKIIPGRTADITDVLIAVLAWMLPWFYRPFLAERAHDDRLAQHPNESTHLKPVRHSWPAVLIILVVTATSAIMYFLPKNPAERPLDESTWHKLPAPDELPAASLPRFRYTHPRLPAPSSTDILRLKAENPDYLNKHRKWARGGTGKLHSVILTAFVEPGSQDMAVLHERLMEMKYTSRGHSQAKPIAVAYDWLYDQWTDTQRAQLHDKLVEGTEYLIHRIREKQRLSPYNVVLYNSPFQALVATSIALYGDDPRGEPAMRFTDDFWKNRVLPVWRQIMGNNGGWHEGGEYVGIGIGEAVYQVPAMWRKATGEDLFLTEPGIRGFINYLVYRNRPDDTDFRWGDRAFYDRAVPDRIPLAIEYEHAAAYSLRHCPDKTEPTAWPWGPLTRHELCDQSAAGRLPLAQYFDGIGLLVARSDWTRDATYITFKAGDHYWSHSHLDQGAFTIYKGGALAIDSGQSAKYGSDHHMNYTHQAIAHNTVTVKDPADEVPIPGKKNKPPRYIANDGGQRRIGSGWGIEAAPLDLAEWEAKSDIYHTATMGNVLMEDDLVVAVADITPAYTNKASGRGTFSHRTRRVERFVRTFAYDRRNEVIVIYDRVTATKPEFWKRWLLHTTDRPLKTPTGFLTNLLATEQRGHSGGRLEGHVLLPEKADIQIIGGRGSEFLVDGKNYDEGGEIYNVTKEKKRSEPGAWRIEVRPPMESYKDDFLIVLLPTDPTESPSHDVRLLREDGRIGCEVTGPERTTRWWFDEGHEGPIIETLTQDGNKQTHDARVTSFSSDL